MVGSNGEFLKWEVAYSIHKVIDESNVHRYDKNLSEQFNLICAMIDRLHDAIICLNNITEAPKTDDALLLCLMHSCVIHAAVKEVHIALGLKYKYDGTAGNCEYKYFRPVVSDAMLRLAPDKDFPTDEKFFEFFRSLAFAHPLKTNRSKFLEKDEVRYSPFVINASGPVVEGESEPMIGVRVYSNKWNDINDLYFPFRTWMNFIRDRYELLKGISTHIKEIVLRKKEEWKKNKINRKLQSRELLEEIVKCLETRHVHAAVLDTAKEALEYYAISADSFSIKTQESVMRYRKVIESVLRALCDAIDRLDYEVFMDVLDPIVNPDVPNDNKYNLVGYKLEKIFNCLGDADESRVRWARTQLKSFSEGFAKKWVDIDLNHVSDAESKLLVIVSCFLEFSQFAKQNQ